ncbi:MAG: hypothetical protein J7J70_04470, partial [Deltaproteobacteria bacterium]|nr:hypothetical protein [Candidatus Tharpellaceae bacterium]
YYTLNCGLGSVSLILAQRDAGDGNTSTINHQPYSSVANILFTFKLLDYFSLCHSRECGNPDSASSAE